MYLPKCDILPKILLQAVNSTSVFSLKCRQITNYTSTAHKHINSFWFKWRLYYQQYNQQS